MKLSIASTFALAREMHLQLGFLAEFPEHAYLTGRTLGHLINDLGGMAAVW
ncbi:hypothetical protein [Undibacterium rugosum]|uniref:hypothetical protein n=1 Tax=Undibacterium rugosum TaxID=2762291 RepID=UPI001B810086|nr:hypothetical protein [Undibacterium rugosum]MBR7777392.1 hypothetical protein [Undibacterium rugosum]